MKEAVFDVDLSIHDFGGRAVVALRGKLNLISASICAWPDELVIFGICSWCDARWRKIQPG
jgi:hypothetical protein